MPRNLQDFDINVNLIVATYLIDESTSSLAGFEVHHDFHQLSGTNNYRFTTGYQHNQSPLTDGGYHENGYTDGKKKKKCLLSEERIALK